MIMMTNLFCLLQASTLVHHHAIQTRMSRGELGTKAEFVTPGMEKTRIILPLNFGIQLSVTIRLLHAKNSLFCNEIV